MSEPMRKIAREELERIKAPIDTALLDDISRGIKRLNRRLEAQVPEGIKDEVNMTVSGVNAVPMQPKTTKPPYFRACLPGDTLVYSNQMPVEIENLKVGDRVYVFGESSIGLREILQVVCTGLKEVFSLRTATRSIKASANHPFLVLEKRPWGQNKTIVCPKCGRSMETRARTGQTTCICGKTIIFDRKIYNIYDKSKLKVPLQQLVWKPLSELRKGDLIVVLSSLPNEGKPFIMPNGEPTSVEFMQMIGLFLGDGWLRTRTRNRGEVVFCIYETESTFNAYLTLITKVFRYKSHILSDGIHVYSFKIAKLLQNIGFGQHALKKELPSWIFSFPREQKIALLRGYLDSDGTVNKDGCIVFRSRSKRLVEQLRFLAITLGFRVSNVHRIKHDFEIINDYGKKYNYYDVEFFSFQISCFNAKEIGSEDALKLERINRRLTYVKRYSYGEARIKLPQQFAFDRIRSLRVLGKSYVFDIMVEDVHNFIAEGILVHNSIFNDGPDPVYVFLNEVKIASLRQAPLNAGDKLDIDTTEAKIEGLFFACPLATNVASLRIHLLK